MLRPDVWGREARLRISNAFGTRPLTLDGVHAGLQLGGGALVPGTNRPVLFSGKDRVTVPPGGEAWSDPVALPFAADPDAALLAGRKLAVSLHVVGASGPMTWHAKALQTSYATAPGAGGHGADEDEAAFPYSTASWFFLDAVDMAVSAPTPVVVAFGDSITDGTASTMNGDDRWPDVLSRRLHANARQPGRGGQCRHRRQPGGRPGGIRPPEALPGRSLRPGAARPRRDRLSGVASVIWLEGINDFSRNGEAALEAVQAGMREGVARLRAGIPGVRVIGATLTSAKGSSSTAHGHPEQDEKRRGLNAFIRESGVFDGVVDFDAATLDPSTGGLRPEMVPESTTGGKGDRLHPNRAGYVAMGSGIDLGVVLGR